MAAAAPHPRGRPLGAPRCGLRASNFPQSPRCLTKLEERRPKEPRTRRGSPTSCSSRSACPQPGGAPAARSVRPSALRPPSLPCGRGRREEEKEGGREGAAPYHPSAALRSPGGGVLCSAGEEVPSSASPPKYTHAYTRSDPAGGSVPKEMGFSRGIPQEIPSLPSKRCGVGGKAASQSVAGGRGTGRGRAEEGRGSSRVPIPPRSTAIVSFVMKSSLTLTKEPEASTQ